VSQALIMLASDRGFPSDISVTAGLLELAQRHGLIGLLAEHARDGMTHAIRVRESLRSQRLSQHLSRLSVKLHDAGIRAAVLKGLSIAEQYSDPTVRTFSDLDILVPRDQMDHAIAVISGDENAKEVPTKRPRADKRDILFEDDSGVRFNVDLHWSLFSYSQLRGAAKDATEHAWEQATFRPDSPWGPLWELPSPHRVAFLASHAVLDHRFRLILFRDLLEMERRGIDWGALDSLARSCGLRSITYVAFWIAQQALDVPVPPDFLRLVRPSSFPISYLEWALPRIDLVRFDGHRPHPVNLATVLLNDSRSERRSLLVKAPFALPDWRRRVARDSRPRDKPRVLIVVTNDRRRGAEVFAERLKDGLVGQGWVAEAVSLYRTDASPSAKVDPLPGARSSEASRFDTGVLRALVSKIRSYAPDIVVANGGPTLRYGVAARLFRRFRLVYIGIGEPEYWIRSKASRWVNRALLRRTDHVIAVSEATRGQLIQLEPRISNRSHIGYTGVPKDLFSVSHPHPDGPLRILVVGSLTVEKDPLLALRAAAAIDGSQIRFVGAGPLERHLHAEAERLGIAHRVNLVGSVHNVAEHFAWADVLILTSRTEGLPGAILEAGAAAVPAVSMDVGGVREAIVDGESGLVVDDERGLVTSLERLDGDRELLRTMGFNARQHVLQHFTIDESVRRYAQLLMEFWR
jgi:glycosyltransferase involved in cell wall biosynthesis